MSHSWRHEQAHPVALVPAHLLQHRFVVPDRRLGSDAGVGPAVGDQELAAARFEFAQIGIHGIHVADLLVEKLHVAIEIELLPIDIRIVVGDAHEIEQAAGSLVGCALRADRIAQRLAGEDQLTLRVLHAAVKRLDGLHLRVGETRIA